MITISDAGKVLAQIDRERAELDRRSIELTLEVNKILQTAFDAVKKIGQQQQAIIQQRIALEETAFQTITGTLEN